MALTYRDAGVDIDEGDRLVELIKPLARPTLRPEVLAGIGGFGGLFALDAKKYREPVLVSGTDGVGTKLKVAFAANRHGTVGQDLVAMCVNDVAVVGAEPLFFLDYFATGKLSAEQGAEVVKGIAEGCRLAGCALIGGETAELPGFYAKGEYDLAVVPGDLVIGVAASGVHSNGYSLARKALLDRHPLDAKLDGLGGRTLADALLEPTRIYAKDVLAILEKVPVRSFAHVTGGGLPGNVPRNLPDGTRAVVDERRWPRPAIFDVIEREGEVPRDEMYRTFNMGLGLVAVVAPQDEAATHAVLRARGLEAWTVGTNLQAILDGCAARRISAELAVVVSNVPGAGALERARRAGVATEVLPSKGVADREAYDLRLVEVLRAHRVDLVCLAGYMRIVTPAFLRAFGPSAATRGCPRVVNVHPGLLPSFPGLHAQRQCVEYGARFAGCTVHFVDEGTDTGPVIVQTVVPVEPGDSEEALARRILEQEHRIYAQAIQWYAEGRLSVDGRRVLVDGARTAALAPATNPQLEIG